jgi:hypothetical protein
MIVIPMVGLSSRFFKSGYTKPKYMLELGEKTVFEHSVGSFEYYFCSHKFLFIVRADYDTPEFVEKKATELGIKDFSIVTLTHETKGQAETVALGLKDIKYKGPITIFNIDTFRLNFRFPEKVFDGYLEVFKGSGANWSYVKTVEENSLLVSETAEKVEISDLCCTGLYHFTNSDFFLKYYEQQKNTDESLWQAGELYVAPMYNSLIQEGCKITYDLIHRKDVVFCGVPDEYESLKRSPFFSNKT